MKKIELKNGKYILVDDDMFDYLSQWKWQVNPQGYAIRWTHVGIAKDGTRKPVYFLLHRVVNNTPEGLFTDHINRDKLDNRRENLRTVNKKENAINTGLFAHNTSGYKGVTWDKSKNKWQAQIQSDKKHIHLGRFSNIQGAILARKLGERLYFKKEANYDTNIPTN